MCRPKICAWHCKVTGLSSTDFCRFEGFSTVTGQVGRAASRTLLPRSTRGGGLAAFKWSATSTCVRALDDARCFGSCSKNVPKPERKARFFNAAIRISYQHLMELSPYTAATLCPLAAKNGPRRARAIFRAAWKAAHELRNLQRDPDAAFVIAAAFMIVAIVAVATIPALMEIPVVGMIAEGYSRNVNPALSLPAITFVVAHNVGVGDYGRCGYASESKKR